MSLKQNDEHCEREDHKVDPFAYVAGSYGSIRPVCTCGWQGREHRISESFQHSNAQREGREHAKETGHECA